jgi:rhamnogalacturonan endolyase
MNKSYTFLLAMMLTSATTYAQPRYNKANMNLEHLNRGVVAVRDGEKVVISWRCLSSDAKGEAFSVYRNGELISSKKLTEGGTFFVDEHPLNTDATYEVRGGAQNGTYTLTAHAPVGYIPIKIDKPEGGTTPDGQRYNYIASDASVGDVDGDGQYEIFLKWDPTNARDNSHAGFTGSTYIDCYRLDGTKLWRIDLGKNIRSGAHYEQFMVYDFDGDGKAELMVKTADGTVDGQGKMIGDPKADWREGMAAILADPEAYQLKLQKEREEEQKRWQEWAEKEKTLPANMSRTERNNLRRRYVNSETQGNYKLGRIMSGPEYLSVFNGLTGAVMDTKDYIPERGIMTDWGDDHANRSDRYLAAVAYLDGKHASGIFCRGYYTRTVIAAWDWDGKELKNRWTFDTKNPELASYAGQGNHNLRVADVDGDGCDEITYGSMALDNDGRGLYNTGMGHGDAMHLTAFDPSTERLQVWDCHENRRDGSDFRDALTGEVIFQIKSREDVGRCMAADIDPTHPGVEMWSSESGGIRNIKGEIVTPKNPAGAFEDEGDENALRVRGARIPTNFGVWWDGDLLREMLDHETVSKYDWTTGRMKNVQHFEGTQFNNGTKSNPCLCADIIGDWREEVLTRNRESTELRLYVSTIPTDYRIDCLEEDIPYRLSVAYQNTAYNQPTQTGFYLGPDKTVRPFLKNK